MAVLLAINNIPSESHEHHELLVGAQNWACQQTVHNAVQCHDTAAPHQNLLETKLHRDEAVMWSHQTRAP